MAKLTINIGAKIDQLKRGLVDSSKAVKSWGNKVSGIGKAAFAGASLGVAGLVAGIGLAIKKSVQLAAAFEQTKIAFNTMLGDAEKAKVLLSELEQFSNKTPFTPEQVLKAGKTLLAFGFQAQDVSKTLRMLGDVSAGTGKDLTELSVIFGQIKGAGRLMGQDLLQLINAGFNPLQVMSEKTGKSMSTLKEEMSKGAISFGMVEQAFKDATSEGGLFFNLMEKQSQSLTGQLSTLEGAQNKLMRGLGNSLLPVIKVVTGHLVKTAGAVDELGQAQERSANKTVGLRAIVASWLDLYSILPSKLTNAALGVDDLGTRAAATSEELEKMAASMERVAQKANVLRDIPDSIDVGGPLFPTLQKAVDEATAEAAKKRTAAGLGFTDTSAQIMQNADSFLAATKSQEEQERTFDRQMAIERQDLADMQAQASKLQTNIGLAFQPGGKIQSRLARIGGDRTISVDRQIPQKQLDQLMKLNDNIKAQTARIDKLDFDQRFPG